MKNDHSLVDYIKLLIVVLGRTDPLWLCCQSWTFRMLLLIVKICCDIVSSSSSSAFNVFCANEIWLSASDWNWLWSQGNRTLAPKWASTWSSGLILTCTITLSVNETHVRNSFRNWTQKVKWNEMNDWLSKLFHVARVWLFEHDEKANSFDHFEKEEEKWTRKSEMRK